MHLHLKLLLLQTVFAIVVVGASPLPVFAEDGFWTGIEAGMTVAWTGERGYEALPGTGTSVDAVWIFGLPGSWSMAASAGFEAWSPTAFGLSGYRYRDRRSFGIATGICYDFSALSPERDVGFSLEADAGSLLTGREDSDYLYFVMELSVKAELSIPLGTHDALIVSLPVGFQHFGETTTIGFGLSTGFRRQTVDPARRYSADPERLDR
ncbi:MAG: hypothetical protein NT080_14780 [Spirochaetes bacterium]|nr:hypothetical protein [Spirochaetota bacterium]